MRKEILDLRQMVGERDGLVSEYLERISSRDLVIQDLKQVLKALISETVFRYYI